MRRHIYFFSYFFLFSVARLLRSESCECACQHYSSLSHSLCCCRVIRKYSFSFLSMWTVEKRVRAWQRGHESLHLSPRVQHTLNTLSTTLFATITQYLMTAHATKIVYGWSWNPIDRMNLLGAIQQTVAFWLCWFYNIFNSIYFKRMMKTIMFFMVLLKICWNVVLTVFLKK